ncbi:MAG: O-antigen ligase family protein [Actinomycetota bacterium]
MVDHTKSSNVRVGWLGRVYGVLLITIFGGIVIHAPLSVGLGTLLPDYGWLIKSWKEILMAVAAILAVILLVRLGKLNILREPLLIIIGAYIVLHLLLLPFFWQGLEASMAGLLIDLRFVVYFALVYVFLRLYPMQRKNFLLVFMVGGIVVVTFALLQVFVLPPDVLKYLGYGQDTIMPYLTVDQNSDYIRINSTLRGPNPLGAYAVIILSFITAALVMKKLPPFRKSRIMAAILVIGGAVALWASYSRSAWIAAVMALSIVVVVSLSGKLSRRAWIISSVVTVALTGIIAASWSTPFVSQVILHEDPTRANMVSSNDGHAQSLKDGVAAAISQPLGAGVGSTGSASLYGNNPVTIENQYVFIAHESGWLGLGIFIVIFGSVMIRLWRSRVSYVALGVFASGIGLAAIGLLLPVWVDDTVAIIWWGLAAVALSGEKK